MNRIGELTMDRDDTIREIRAALKRRSGKAWSVNGGRGTSYGWLTIAAPPARRTDFGYLSDADQRELADLLGVAVHHQGVMVPSGNDYYREYIDRANGREPSVCGRP